MHRSSRESRSSRRASGTEAATAGRPRSRGFVATFALACGLATFVASTVLAQGADRPAWPQPRDQDTRRGGRAEADRLRGLRDVLQEDSRQPFEPAQPFPTLPPTLPGLSRYPGLGLPPPFANADPAQPLPFDPSTLPPRDPNAWPKWIAADDSVRADEGFLPDRAILSRSADRVWYLGPTSPAFVPLSFHDKVRLVVAGSQIQVPGAGEFQLLFHGGSTLRSRGEVSLIVDGLDETGVRVSLLEYDNVWIQARSRPVRVQIGSGEIITVDNALAYLSREGEIGALQNSGGVRVAIESAVTAEPTEVPNAHRVEVLARAVRTGTPPAALALGGDLDVEEEGRILRADGGAGGGAVVWNGARITVQPGASLTIDPLAGSSFPSQRPDSP